MEDSSFKTQNGGCEDQGDLIVWSNFSDTKNWNNAKNYCDDLTVNQFNDWKLPSTSDFIRTASPSTMNYIDVYTGQYFWTSDDPSFWPHPSGCQ